MMTTKEPGDGPVEDKADKSDSSDSTVAETPGLKKAGADASPGNTAQSVLPILLADHPEAVFYAVRADSVVIPMPDSVDLGDHEVLQGRSALDLVIPENRGTVIDTWDKATKAGVKTGLAQ